MFFSGALGALFMYSILHSRNEQCRQANGRQVCREGLPEQEIGGRVTRERNAQRHVLQQSKAESPIFSGQGTLQQSAQHQEVYIPREVIREVIVDCSCKCACKEPEIPDIPRSYWSLDQGKFVRAAGNKEAKKAQKRRREEVAKTMMYWSLDQGMHADVKAKV